MDPTIMKLLEDDEDESMHSGADVEAFTAALNRDIEGGASSISDPLESRTVGILSQGNGSTANQLYGQWQISSQEENLTQKIQRLEQQHLQPQEQHSSHMELIKQPCGVENQHQQTGSQAEKDQLLQSHTDKPQRQAPQSDEKNQVQISRQNPVQCPEQDRTQRSECQQQYSEQQLNNQLNSTSNQSSNQLRQMKLGSSKQLQMLILILRSHLDKDRYMQVQTICAKLMSNEVNQEDCLRVVRNIVGDQMFRQAVNKVKQQLQAEAARNSKTTCNLQQSETQASPQQLTPLGSQQLSEAQSFSQLPPVSSTQKGHKSPNQASASTVQMQNFSKVSNFENSSRKSKEIVNQLDVPGLRASQIASINMNMAKQERELLIVSLQTVNQQQQHSQLPPTFFSMCGETVSNHNVPTFPRPPVSAPATSLKSQTLDSQIRQTLRPQDMASTQLGVTQPLILMNRTKHDLQNAAGETNRLQGGSPSHFTNHSALQQNQSTWQPPANEEQISSGLSSLAYVKQELVEGAAELQQKAQFSALQESSLGSVHIDQWNPSPGSPKDETIGKQTSRMGLSAARNQMAGAPVQLDPMMQISSATPPVVDGCNTKTPPKKPVGQKKSLEALVTPSPQAIKRQKVAGAYHDQSIEQLNDVTAVSGVNLREEEEQLLSAPKEESRASEATRRVVQEEELRIVLQKGPLRKKIAEITSKYSVKSISSDVERCLSMSMEERLRGLISNLIRISKQRVDVEKAQHQIFFTSDVRRQILLMNQKAKEESEKNQTEEAEKLWKLNETEGKTGADAEKDKEEGRSKSIKLNKEEDDKMRATAANVAARAAVGGDDMLSKWQLMAEQARQKREGGLDGVSVSLPSKFASCKPLSQLGRNSRRNQAAERKGPSAASTSGAVRKLGRSPVIVPRPKVVRSISTKDVIAVLEREPQMSNSSLMYRLYERISGYSAAE